MSFLCYHTYKRWSYYTPFSIYLYKKFRSQNHSYREHGLGTSASSSARLQFRAFLHCPKTFCTRKLRCRYIRRLTFYAQTINRGNFIGRCYRFSYSGSVFSLSLKTHKGMAYTFRHSPTRTYLKRSRPCYRIRGYQYQCGFQF